MISKKVKLPALPACIRRHGPLMLVLVGTFVAIAAYLRALNFPFISDDSFYITSNARLAGLHLGELWRLFVESYNPYEFLPLRDFSYWLDMALFGLTPSAFRIHNILLYVLCCLLVHGATFSLWRYFKPADTESAPWVAAIVTALFAIHPAHVEAVVWISGRKDVLSGMFSMLALWLALKAKQGQGLSPRYAVLTLIALSAAMLSKGVSVVVAPIIAMLWIIFWRDIPAPSRRYPQLLWPLAILFLAACFAVIFTAHSTIRVPAYWGGETIPRALAALGWMARLAVTPEGRHYFYPVFEDPLLPLMVTVGGGVILAGAVGMAMLWRKKSLEGFALAAYVLLCMPYTQLLPYKTFSLVSDRFLFLAVWLAILLIVALAWRLKPISRAVILVAIALPWMQQAVERPAAWRGVEALADADLDVYPGYYLPALYKINQIQLPQGLYREAQETASNIRDPEMKNIAIELIRSDYAVYAYAWSTGKTDEAISSLWNLDTMRKRTPARVKWDPSLAFIWESIRIRLDIRWKYLADKFPADAPVRYNAGLWLLSDGKYEEAATHLRAATESRLLPEAVRGAAFKELGIAMLKAGHIAEAEVPLHAALNQLPPDTGAYCSLAEVYRRTGRVEEAARAEVECHNHVQSEEFTQ